MVIKAAIVGLGRIASLLEDDALREKPCTHAGAITVTPGLSLCAGADIDGERRRLFAEKWKVPVYDDAEAMVRQERPHILHIATHPDSHWRYCSLAAHYGVSVAVCEKPLADTLGEAKKIAALHESGKITVITNHERRYAADYAQARVILAGGNRLGPLTGVRGKLYVGKTRRLLDLLWHDGTHLADAAMFLTGAVLKHRKTIAENRYKAGGGLMSGGLKARSGTAYLFGRLDNPSVPAVNPLPFLLELGAGRDHLTFELEFSCERGKLVIGNGIYEVWESRESPYAEGFRSLVKCDAGFTGPTGYFSNMAANALVCAQQRLNGSSADPAVSTAADGLRVIRYLRSVKAWR
ncbi:MAG: Gfo/Idh/MocA family oxidoreductase [Spirochaetaceae bacterium]|jgi:predicted dehydrogenase|nr:Gfo/Idh/MocA family oxidoreductase [Spirochaetaceae bacterium]